MWYSTSFYFLFHLIFFILYSFIFFIISKEGRSFKHFLDLLRRYNEPTSSQPINPRKLKNYFVKFHASFNNSNQHDAQEFMGLLLNMIGEAKPARCYLFLFIFIVFICKI